MDVNVLYDLQLKSSKKSVICIKCSPDIETQSKSLILILILIRGFAMVTLAFSIPQEQQFFSFMYPPKQKCASYEKIIWFSLSCPSSNIWVI